MIRTSQTQQLLTNFLHLGSSLKCELYLFAHLFGHLETLHSFSFNDVKQVFFFQSINYLLKSFFLYLIFLKEVVVKILLNFLFLFLKIQFFLLYLCLPLLKR